MIALRVRLMCSVAAGTLAMAACGSDSTAPNGGAGGLAYVRVVNSVYQIRHTGSVVDTVAVPLEILINGSTSAPGAASLAANGMTTGDSANGYAPVTPGITSFDARIATDPVPGRTIYTGYDGNKSYVPKLALTPGRYHTLIVAGIVPDTGVIPGGTVSFSLWDDDQFPGAIVDGVPQARFVLLHASPFAAFGISYYLTQGAVPGNLLADYQPSGGAYYQCGFGCNYRDVAPGTYTLTVANGDLYSTRTAVAQQTVTFAPGEVVTGILQSSAATDTPTPGNQLLRVVHDHPPQ